MSHFLNSVYKYYTLPITENEKCGRAKGIDRLLNKAKLEGQLNGFICPLANLWSVKYFVDFEGGT